MSTETESEFDDSSGTLCAVMHIENSTERLERSETVASYLMLGVIGAESVLFATGGSGLARAVYVVALCLYLVIWLGRARTYRKQLLDLAERHREVLNE